MDYTEEVVADSEGEDNHLLDPSVEALHYSMNFPNGSGACDADPHRSAVDTHMPTPQNDAYPSTNADMDSMGSGIADRAKLRARKTKTIAPPIDIIELSSEDEFNLLPPSRPKEKRQKKVTPAETPSSPAARPKPRPRPRPVLKTNKPSTPADQTFASVVPIYQRDTPAPLSSSGPQELPIPFKLLPSLPPSDPASSLSNPYDLPPIETLPNFDTDIPSSSPSSLFDVDSSRKRKRVRATSPIDQLDPDSSAVVDRRMMPPPNPPSTFFAGSSSPPTDLTNTGPTKNQDPQPIEKPPSNKKQRKKEGATAEARKKRPKAPKTKGKVVENRAEVVIEQKPKNKGKGKAKEAFKSSEFIEEDEDAGPAAPATNKTPDRASSMTSLSSLPDSDPPGPGVAEGSKKRKSPDGPPFEENVEVVPPPKKKANTKGKRKTTLLSDDELAGLDKGTEEPTTTKKKKRPPPKGKRKQTHLSDDEDVANRPAEPINATPIQCGNESTSKSNAKGKGKSAKEGDSRESLSGSIEERVEGNSMTKENVQPQELQTPIPPKPSTKPAGTPFPSLASRYTIAPKTKSTPMSELIKRVNSMPGSPFPSPSPRTSISSTAYSPYLKSSRSALSRIAPLHPNRRTPPPPLPPPPPRKKTKKELEMEERWEEELVESVGGITEWACMTDAERVELRRAKRERETAGWED